MNTELGENVDDVVVSVEVIKYLAVLMAESKAFNQFYRESMDQSIVADLIRHVSFERAKTKSITVTPSERVTFLGPRPR